MKNGGSRTRLEQRRWCGCAEPCQTHSWSQPTPCRTALRGRCRRGFLRQCASGGRPPIASDEQWARKPAVIACAAWCGSYTSCTSARGSACLRSGLAQPRIARGKHCRRKPSKCFSKASTSQVSLRLSTTSCTTPMTASSCKTACVDAQNEIAHCNALNGASSWRRAWQCRGGVACWLLLVAIQVRH